MSARPLIAVLASAVLFGVSIPLAKLLLGGIPPIALAGLLYSGAFLGLGAYRGAAGCARSRSRAHGSAKEAPLEKRDLPWLAGAILTGGIAAPILLMFGLGRVTGFAGSLLLNFEAAATALIAVLLFREHAGRRVWAALALMTAGGVLLTWNSGQARLDLAGPLLVLAAMAGWGLDNNLTRRISDKDPVQIAMFKGLVSGAFSLGLAFALGQGLSPRFPVLAGLAVGTLGYGLSLVLFIKGLNGLGAFRAGALFSIAPFAGALASIVILGERVRPVMAAAGLVMAIAVALVAREKHAHAHHHDPMIHAHAHVHSDLHHDHVHAGDVRGPHLHEHVHEGKDHVHGHWPDSGHRHGH
jgi:drug/metabolite transporter (DMT)-like permease